jgi:hypothetical protein
MSEIDVGGDAEAKIKSIFPDAKNIDLSGLTVTVDPTKYDAPVLQTKAPQQVWSQTLVNCTRQTRQEHVTRSFEVSTSWSVTLSATLKLSRSIGSMIKAVATVILNSAIGVDISLTGSGTVSGSSRQSKTIDEITPAAPCSQVTLTVMESVAVYTVDFHIPVNVRGTISLDVPSGALVFGTWYTIHVPYSAHYTIDGKGAVTGSDLTTNWSEYRASCPVGTPCSSLSSLSDEEFWKRMKPAPEVPKTPAKSE